MRFSSPGQLTRFLLAATFALGLSNLGLVIRDAAAQEPCTNGTAAGFSCANIDLLAHVDLPQFSSGPTAGNDIWGFVDLNTDREYAIIGVNNGTGFFDVSDPVNPFLVGLIPGQSTSWRDIKVYQFFDDNLNRWQAYAYVTADGATDGLFIVDLTGLPHSVAKVSFGSDFSRAHNVFAANTDYSTGVSLTGNVPQLIVAGSNISASAVNHGQFRIYSLANPRAPSFVGTAPAAGDMHDVTTFFVTDQRKDSQCVNATAVSACEVLVDFSGSRLDIWDITDPTTPVLLSQPGLKYPQQSFAHSGWQSEDTQHLFVNDEFDEPNFGLFTTLNVLSLADLTNPVSVGTWTGPTLARDHNSFVRGNRLYMTNYTRGLTILDITDPTTPVDPALGYFDTYAPSDSVVFEGAWGVYPFFPSGTIAVSDINSGLYLLHDTTRNVTEGRFGFSAPTFAVEEGQQGLVLVQRLGGTTGAVSVDYQIVPATADSSDYQAPTGTLNWANGDSANKTIAINPTDDMINEGLERLILRLVNPTGGATLDDANTASLYISDAGAQSTVGFLDTTIESGETGVTNVVLVVQRTGSALGQASVDYAISGGDASSGADFVGDTDGTLVWADGDAQPRSLLITIIDDADTEETEFFDITLSAPVNAVIGAAATARINISSNEGPAPTVPPPTQPPSSGGGGAPAPVSLAVLVLFLMSRLNRAGSVRRSVGRRH